MNVVRAGCRVAEAFGTFRRVNLELWGNLRGRVAPGSPGEAGIGIPRGNRNPLLRGNCHPAGLGLVPGIVAGS